MLGLIAFAVFVVVALAAFAFLAVFDERSAQARVLKERLSGIERAEQRGGPTEELQLLRDELLSEIPSLNRLLARWRSVSRLQVFLSQGDIKLRAGKFVLICAATAACAGFVAATFARNNFLGLLAAALGAAAPFMYASFRRAQRFSKFEKMFPEAIDLLARATRAGHAFTTALELIGSELGDPVGSEFRKLFQEQKFGLPLRDALLNLAERVPLMDVKFFVTALMLQRETGGNLAEILDKLSYVIRERFKILRQVKVYTAQGRLTMIILLSLPPGLVCLLMMMNPGFMRPLFTDPLGHVMVACGIVLQVIGFFLIRKIIHIKV